MCGICGELALHGARADERSLAGMLGALAHRGPDDKGVHLDGPVGLGHARLSIIDLSARGRQPIFSDDGSMAIVFNGEIYNYQEIQADLLARGRTFKSATDTEVAVTAISEYGLTAALERFIGMFAIAVWDVKRRALILTRDRLGIKPLYYALLPDSLLFASEPRAILAHPAYSAQVNTRAVASFLMAGYFPGEETILAGVRKLPPGTWMEATPAAQVSQGRYWSLEGIRRGAYTGSFDNAQRDLRQLFDSAFGYRLVADVPVGMFLSGGVDSSLVASVLKNDLGVDLVNFTIGFKEQGFNEADKAAALCRRLGVPHVVRQLDPKAAQDALDTYCSIYDEPFGDPSGIPTYLVSALAREQVKVALSADGGDELFCGYTGHTRYPALYRRLAALPAGLRRALAGAARSLPIESLLSGSHSRRGQARAERYGRLVELMRADSPAELLAVYAARGFFAAETAALLGLSDVALPDGFLDAPLPQGAGADELSSLLMAHDVRYWLPDDILVKVDRASMHVGLECRDPLLDHRIAEFAAALPMGYLVQDGRQKHILRQMLAGLAGQDAAQQPKLGFDIPLSAWLSGPWRAHVDQHLSPERLAAVGVLDPAPTRRVVERFLAGQGESAQRVWLLLALQMWAARWLGA